jgi:hypothetical protein
MTELRRVIRHGPHEPVCETKGQRRRLKASASRLAGIALPHGIEKTHEDVEDHVTGVVGVLEVDASELRKARFDQIGASIRPTRGFEVREQPWPQCMG